MTQRTQSKIVGRGTDLTTGNDNCRIFRAIWPQECAQGHRIDVGDYYTRHTGYGSHEVKNFCRTCRPFEWDDVA